MLYNSSVLLSHYHQPIQLASNQMFCTCITLLSYPSLPRPGLQALVSGTREGSADAAWFICRIGSVLGVRNVFNLLRRQETELHWVLLCLSQGKFTRLQHLLMRVPVSVGVYLFCETQNKGKFAFFFFLPFSQKSSIGALCWSLWENTWRFDLEPYHRVLSGF